MKFAGKRVYIHQISVNPDVREKGLGQALLQEVIRLAEDLDISEIALDTWAFNRRAREFFAGRGFLEYNIRMWRRVDPG